MPSLRMPSGVSSELSETRRFLPLGTRSGVLVFSTMADSGDGEYERCALVKAIVGEKRNGVLLPPVLVGYTIPYIIDSGIAFGDDAEEVKSSMPATGSEWMGVFNEAWATNVEKPMPSLFSTRASTWSGLTEVLMKPPPPPGIEVSAAMGGAASGASTSADTGMMRNSSAFSDAHISQMMAGLVVSDHDVTKAISDITFQRISGVRALGLSLALQSGSVHPAGESADLRYCSDLRLCPLIRQQRKAGVESLDDKVKAKNKRELASHYSRLAKDYSDRGMIEEATLVSQFWSESTGAFEGDDTGLFIYLAEWNRRYAGRGIPKLLDTDLVLRNRKEAGGASSQDMKKLEEVVKGLQSKISASESRSTDLAKRLTRAEAKSASAVDLTKDSPKGGDKACFICGGNHLAKNCPNKRKGKDDSAGDDGKDDE